MEFLNGSVLPFVEQYWGILSLVVIFIGTYFYNKQRAIEIAKDLIVYIEKYAENHAIKNGQEKFQWVSENGYAILPPVAKIFISKQAFDIIIQYAFDKLIDWAEENIKE